VGFSPRGALAPLLSVARFGSTSVSRTLHKYTPRGGGKRKLRGIVRTGQSRLRRGGRVDVPATKAGGDAGGRVFIQMEADRRRSGGFL